MQQSINTRYIFVYDNTALDIVSCELPSQLIRVDAAALMSESEAEADLLSLLMFLRRLAAMIHLSVFSDCGAVTLLGERPAE